MERLVGFLYEDLVHLFDDQGIDQTAYDERVKFRDPITKHDTITGYLLNIAFLKIVFMPKFQLHWAKQVHLWKELENGEDAELSKVSIKICLPLDKDISSLPDRNQETISLKKVEEGIAAVVKFSGKPTEDIVHEKEKALRASLIRDGLKLKEGCSLAVTSKLNSFYKSLVFFILFAPFGYKRNEVLIGLEEFTLD